MEPLTVNCIMCYALSSEVKNIDMEKKRMELPRTLKELEKWLTDGHSYEFKDWDGHGWKVEYEVITYYITALSGEEERQFLSLEKAVIDMLCLMGLFLPKGDISEQEQA